MARTRCLRGPWILAGSLLTAILVVCLSSVPAQDGASAGKDGHAVDPPASEGGSFAPNAFPPTLSDSTWHAKAWERNDCLRCHETGVEHAPRVRHRGMPDILLTAMCRTCHVLIPGSQPKARAETSAVTEDGFAANAFPPMIPNSVYHKDAWEIPNCLLCHEDGILGAPVVEHEDLPRILLKSKCRTCHVQVRAIDSDDPTGH